MTNFIDINGLSAAINKAQDTFLYKITAWTGSDKAFGITRGSSYFLILSNPYYQKQILFVSHDIGNEEFHVYHIGGEVFVNDFAHIWDDTDYVIGIFFSGFSTDTLVEVIPINEKKYNGSAYKIEIYIGEALSNLTLDSGGYVFEDANQPKYKINTRAVSNFTAETENYYRFSANVGTITITLPTISADSNHVHSIFFYFTTSASPAITFSSTHTIKYYDSYEIEANKTYEVNALYNGAAWVITSSEISAT